jgi:hypothetical protein
MGKLLFNITWANHKPSVEEVIQKFGLSPGEIDLEFGVMVIDPQDDLYCILVEESMLERLGGQPGEKPADLEGPFANPPIEPFGPPDR